MWVWREEGGEGWRGGRVVGGKRWNVEGYGRRGTNEWRDQELKSLQGAVDPVARAVISISLLSLAKVQTARSLSICVPLWQRATQSSYRDVTVPKSFGS